MSTAVLQGVTVSAWVAAPDGSGRSRVVFDAKTNVAHTNGVPADSRKGLIGIGPNPGITTMLTRAWNTGLAITVTGAEELGTGGTLVFRREDQDLVAHLHAYAWVYWEGDSPKAKCPESGQEIKHGLYGLGLTRQWQENLTVIALAEAKDVIKKFPPVI